MSYPAVFVDRDGTLIEHYDYLTDPGQVELLPTAAPALRLLKERGFVVVMVTNQSAVARGMLTEAKLLEIHDRLKALLAEQGAYLDQIYYCPYHPEGAVPQYRRESELRKPAPGMLQLAARELDLDLSRSWVVGDDDRDVQAGRAAGCRTILLELAAPGPLVQRGQSEPDFRALNLLEAANLIVRHGTEPVVSPEGPVETQAGAAREPAAQTPAAQADRSQVVAGTEATTPAATEETSPMEVSTGSPDETVTDHPRPAAETDAASLGDDRWPPAPHAARPRGTASGSGDTGEGRATARVGASGRRKPPGGAPSTRELLTQMLREVKQLNRERRFTEFSVPKLLAGVVQMVVLLCLILAFWFRSGPEPNVAAAQNCLLLALVFQVMTVTFLVMHRL